MKIGIFGGTFNPPHTGHLIVAEHVRQELGIARIVFVPTAIPPHKQELDIPAVEHRLAMVRCAVQGNAHFEVSDLEARRGGVSFTVDTLTEFRKQFPLHELLLLLGMDNVREFHTWKHPDRIKDLASIVALTRPGVAIDKELVTMKNIIMCEVPDIAIASSTVRKMVNDGKSIRYLVPSAVELYIVEHHLYQ